MCQGMGKAQVRNDIHNWGRGESGNWKQFIVHIKLKVKMTLVKMDKNKYCTFKSIFVPLISFKIWKILTMGHSSKSESIAFF